VGVKSVMLMVEIFRQPTNLLIENQPYLEWGSQLAPVLQIVSKTSTRLVGYGRPILIQHLSQRIHSIGKGSAPFLVWLKWRVEIGRSSTDVDYISKHSFFYPNHKNYMSE
jgi:hypothetical protein